MKVLLVNPPRRVFSGSSSLEAGLPLGLLYVAAVLDKAGVAVEVLDTLANCAPPRRERDSFQYGMDWGQIQAEIRRRQPDIVGIGNPFSSQIDNAVEVARIVKDIDPRIPTVIGGPHASIQYSSLLQENPCVDVAVRGEGEYAMLKLVQAYQERKGNLEGISGIAYRNKGNVVVNPAPELIAPLDQLPFPAYHLVEMESYLRPKRVRYRTSKFRPEIPFITSRGCPFDCIFCSVNIHMGRRWREHSAEYVVNHLEHVVRRYGVEQIHFEDDNMTLDMDRFDQILKGVQERRIKFGWDASNGVRADRLNISLLKKMKECGCTDIHIGVESGDQWVLDNVVKKNLKLENVVKTASMAKEARLRVTAFYIIGFPGEKKENMQRTVDFALSLKRQYDVGMSLFVATPLYGTRLFKVCQEKNYFSREPTARALSEATQVWGTGLIKTEDFSPEDVNGIALKALKVYSRLNFVNHLKHPLTTVRKAIYLRRDAFRYLKTLVGRS